MSPDETALRAAVAAAPDAALPRLVLADFLDDQNQPALAAALRLDVALSAERPWADRYWQLKAEQPPDFPADLGRLADRQPLLCGVPDDWRSRWRAVRAFVSRWWNVPLGDVGRWGAAVEEAERVAGRELPAGVKEWAAFSTELAALDEEAFYDPLGFSNLGDAAGLLERAEVDVVWAVPDDGLRADDSPVKLYSFPWYGGNQTRHIEAYADTIAGFALFYLLTCRDLQRDVPFPDMTRITLQRFCGHTGRFDLAEVYEGPQRAALMLPPGTWRETWGRHVHAQLFDL